MTIVASAVTRDAVQADGRRRIVEEHTDSRGVAHRVCFLAPSDWAAQAYLPTRAAQIEKQLADAEIEANAAEIENG